MEDQPNPSAPKQEPHLEQSLPVSDWYIKTPGVRPPQEEIVISSDHIIHRQGKDFVLYGGLLNAAHKAGLQCIRTSLVQCPSEHNGGTAVVHATAEFPWGSFDGIGDADDGNVSKNIQPHKIRMAETRAKARCLRDALNVAMVAIEEMGPEPGNDPAQQNRQASNGSSGSGAAPRPVQRRPDGSSSVTSSPGERKSYGTPMTKPPVEGRSTWPGGE